MESAVGCLWIQTAGATIGLTVPLSFWRKQLYYRQIPVVSFALLFVEAVSAQTKFQVHCFSSKKIPASTAPAFERHLQAAFGLVKIAVTFDVAPRDVRFLVNSFKEFSSATACRSVDKRLVGYLFVQVW
jgi:hypothetical protein